MLSEIEKEHMLDKVPLLLEDKINLIPSKERQEKSRKF